MDTKKVDKLSLLRGKALKLTDTIGIYHPTLGEIENIGQEEYSDLLFTLISTSLDVADILWFEQQIWYETIESEWEFFIQKSIAGAGFANVKIMDGDTVIRVEPNCALVSKAYRNSLNFFLGTTGEYIGVQFSIPGTDKLQTVLYNVSYDKNNALYIDYKESFKFTEDFYTVTNSFLREVHYISSEYEFLTGGTKGAKISILKYNIYNQRKKKRKNKVTLDSIVSSLIAKGQDAEKIWGFPIHLIYDIYYRLNKINQYENMALGYYTGNVGTDPKKPIDWEKINWSNVIQ